MNGTAERVKTWIVKVTSEVSSVTNLAPSNTSTKATATFQATSGEASGRQTPGAVEPMLVRLICCWQGS